MYSDTTYGPGSVTYFKMVVENSTIWVNTDNGVVEYAEFNDAMPQSPPEIEVNRDEAYAKAMEFAGQKYDGFSGKNWALVVDKMAGPSDGIRGYVFVCREEIRSEDGTVLLPHIVVVSINPETGAIIHYLNMNLDGPSFSFYLEHIDENIIGP